MKIAGISFLSFLTFFGHATWPMGSSQLGLEPAPAGSEAQGLEPSPGRGVSLGRCGLWVWAVSGQLQSSTLAAGRRPPHFHTVGTTGPRSPALLPACLLGTWVLLLDTKARLSKEPSLASWTPARQTSPCASPHPPAPHP